MVWFGNSNRHKIVKYRADTKPYYTGFFLIPNITKIDLYYNKEPQNLLYEININPTRYNQKINTNYYLTALQNLLDSNLVNEIDKRTFTVRTPDGIEDFYTYDELIEYIPDNIKKIKQPVQDYIYLLAQLDKVSPYEAKVNLFSDIITLGYALIVFDYINLFYYDKPEEGKKLLFDIIKRTDATLYILLNDIIKDDIREFKNYEGLSDWFYYIYLALNNLANFVDRTSDDILTIKLLKRLTQFIKTKKNDLKTYGMNPTRIQKYIALSYLIDNKKMEKFYEYLFTEGKKGLTYVVNMDSITLFDDKSLDIKYIVTSYLLENNYEFAYNLIKKKPEYIIPIYVFTTLTATLFPEIAKQNIWKFRDKVTCFNDSFIFENIYNGYEMVIDYLKQKSPALSKEQIHKEIIEYIALYYALSKYYAQIPEFDLKYAISNLLYMLYDYTEDKIFLKSRKIFTEYGIASKDVDDITSTVLSIAE